MKMIKQIIDKLFKRKPKPEKESLLGRLLESYGRRNGWGRNQLK
jgi:hypothetical protein